MSTENLAYALVQWVHNFGAAAVVGAAAFALWPAFRPAAGRAFAWLALAAWLAQIASGAGFGLVSLHFYGATPDLAPVARVALGVKIGAAIGGTLLAASYLRWGRHWPAAGVRRVFLGLAALGATALTAAAWLRWFS